MGLVAQQVALQHPERFVANPSAVKVGFTDLPGLLAAMRDGPFGRLCLEPEVKAAIEQGMAGARKPSQQWVQCIDRLMALQPDLVQWEEQVYAEIYRQDWSHWRSLAIHHFLDANEWE